MEICSYRLAKVDRKWPGRHMYCSKHNYGPMDSWYNCEECSNEVGDEFEVHQQSDEYKEGWQLIRTGKYAERQTKDHLPVAARGAEVLQDVNHPEEDPSRIGGAVDDDLHVDAERAIVSSMGVCAGLHGHVRGGCMGS